MQGNVRPETMERITTPELAQAFIEEQLADNKHLKTAIAQCNLVLAKNKKLKAALIK